VFGNCLASQNPSILLLKPDSGVATGARNVRCSSSFLIGLGAYLSSRSPIQPSNLAHSDARTYALLDKILERGRRRTCLRQLLQPGTRQKRGTGSALVEVGETTAGAAGGDPGRRRSELLEEIRDSIWRSGGDDRSCWRRSGTADFEIAEAKSGGNTAAGGETHGGRSRWDGSSAVPWSGGDERIESKRGKNEQFFTRRWHIRVISSCSGVCCSAELPKGCSAVCTAK
jgi:hypothetical protein